MNVLKLMKLHQNFEKLKVFVLDKQKLSLFDCTKKRNLFQSSKNHDEMVINLHNLFNLMNNNEKNKFVNEMKNYLDEDILNIILS